MQSQEEALSTAGCISQNNVLTLFRTLQTKCFLGGTRVCRLFGLLVPGSSISSCPYWPSSQREKRKGEKLVWQQAAPRVNDRATASAQPIVRLHEQELALQGTSKLNPSGFSRGTAVGVPRPGEAPQDFGMQRCPGPESPSGRVLLAGAQGPGEPTWLAVSFAPRSGFGITATTRAPTLRPRASLPRSGWCYLEGAQGSGWGLGLVTQKCRFFICGGKGGAHPPHCTQLPLSPAPTAWPLASPKPLHDEAVSEAASRAQSFQLALLVSANLRSVS